MSASILTASAAFVAAIQVAAADGAYGGYGSYGRKMGAMGSYGGYGAMSAKPSYALPKGCDGDDCGMEWRKCGGRDFPTSIPCCREDLVCTVKNFWYAQCLTEERAAENMADHDWDGRSLECEPIPAELEPEPTSYMPDAPEPTYDAEAPEPSYDTNAPAPDMAEECDTETDCDGLCMKCDDGYCGIDHYVSRFTTDTMGFTVIDGVYHEESKRTFVWTTKSECADSCTGMCKMVGWTASDKDCEGDSCMGMCYEMINEDVVLCPGEDCVSVLVRDPASFLLIKDGSCGTSTMI